jgi:hypothetical protein
MLEIRQRSGHTNSCAEIVGFGRTAIAKDYKCQSSRRDSAWDVW